MRKPFTSAAVPLFPIGFVMPIYKVIQDKRAQKAGVMYLSYSVDNALLTVRTQYDGAYRVPYPFSVKDANT